MGKSVLIRSFVPSWIWITYPDAQAQNVIIQIKFKLAVHYDGLIQGHTWSRYDSSGTNVVEILR